MRVLWLVSRALAQLVTDKGDVRNLLACSLASARLRMGVAANEWRDRGNENLFRVPAAFHDQPPLDWRDVQICIVSKFLRGELPTLWLEACRTAKRNGCQLVMDICDYPFQENPIDVDEFYSQALPMTDALVVNSGNMAVKMAPHFRKKITVIEDAILDTAAPPAFSPSEKIKLLWFGHPTNLRFLMPFVSRLVESGPRPCRLAIVTLDGFGVKEFALNIQARHAPEFEVQFVEWSLESTRRELAECDLVILPSDPWDTLKGGASANRIAEVLNAGRFPVANPLHSYRPFADAAWLGNNLIEGIAWAQANHNEVLERIHRGQMLVSEQFEMHKIGQQWCEWFHAIGAPASNPSGIIRHLRRFLP